ncbi:hypothetical protein LAZ67_4002495 [Cordylochernes scorpioides]|uniref:Retrotransposon gag domain-containing protein n=1 Tax=Cordylochernes scorpioides TaxID=51811 RepID=A0ABY6KDK7_9ARAC|nr:hypothetical protein LAZ67_4002495 [Cordylochernes scorpioides]
MLQWPPILAKFQPHQRVQWLKEYERVSKYNRWDDNMKLANVVFYLNGTAGRWFDNNEESLNSWRSFEEAFRGVFGLQEDSA